MKPTNPTNNHIETSHYYFAVPPMDTSVQHLIAKDMLVVDGKETIVCMMEQKK